MVPTSKQAASEDPKQYSLDGGRFAELKATGRLPSPKGVALAIMRMTQKEDVAIAEVVRTIKTDPALSGRLVKAANLGGVPGRRPVAAIPDAIVVLGMATVRQLALGFSLVSGYRDGGCKAFDYDRYWSRSLVTAIAMQALTVRSRAAPGEEAFVAGLLARIGCLALATLYPAQYGDILQAAGSSDDPAAMLRAEREQFTTDHIELAAALMAEWGLPQVFIDAVVHHENPAASGYTEGSRAHVLAWSLQFANRVADLCLAPPPQRRQMLTGLFLLGTKLGFEAETVTALSDQIVRDWQEWGSVLNIRAEKLPPMGDIAAEQAEASSILEDAKKAAETTPLKVLAIDDDRAMLLMLRKLLTDAGHTVLTAPNGREGLAIALQENPQLVVTDWIMPEMDGLTFCRQLRETKVGRGMYVLILTGLEDEERVIEAFEAGADDYVAKPFSPRVLHARLRAGERMIRLQAEIEADREDIRRFASELALTNRKLQQAALLDPLTEIPNRRYAMDRLQQEWASAQRNRQPLTLMMIDVDGFKAFNDTYGHDVGDRMLRHTVSVLRRSARAADVICRIGGEEFLVICPNTDTPAAGQVAERLRLAVAHSRLDLGTVSLLTTISVGIATAAAEMPGPEAVLKAADQAVYAAKAGGRNRTCIHRAGGATDGRPKR